MLLTLTSTTKSAGHIAKVKMERLAENDSEGIKFHEGDWQSALTLAKKEGKMIFLDSHASWCRPCKMMAKKAFIDERVAEYFNAKLINFKMDMEKHPEGPRLAKKFNLTLYPTLFFMLPDEKIIDYSTGYHSPKHLLQVAESAEKTYRKM